MMEDNKNNDPVSFEFEEIFSMETMQKIERSDEPKSYAFELLETFARKKYGKTDIQSNILMAQAEFHVYNLAFLREKFALFPDEIICKLLNLLGILLDLKEVEYNKNLKGSLGDEDEIKKYETVPEPDFAFICNRKLNQLKLGLQILKFIPKNREEILQANANLFQTASDYDHNDFHLDEKELQLILEYLSMFYFPFIRLYYHFCNIDRITENKKIEVVVNRPLPIPPLSLAVGQKVEKNMFDEQKEEEEEDENGEKKKNQNEAMDEEEDEEGEVEEEIEKKDTFQDIMNRVNMNQETKKIITERINEHHKDFDAKISDRQRKIDEKIKEIEESVKPKKK